MMHRRFSRIRLLAVALAAGALVLTGCSSPAGTTPTSSGGSGDLSQFTSAVNTYYKGTFATPPTVAAAPPDLSNVWIISCGQSAEACSRLTAGVNDGAKAAGWKTTVFDGNLGIGDAYNTGLRQAVAAHADLVIAVSINCNQAKAGFAAVRAADIPLVGSNSYDCSDPNVASGTDLFTAVPKVSATTPTAADLATLTGKAKADWLISATKGKARVIVLNFQGLTAGVYLNQGFDAEMKKCAGCTIVATVDFSPADLANGNLKAQFSTTFAKYPTANAVMFPFDATGLAGAVPQTVVGSGRTASVQVMGGEGFPANLALISSGRGQNAATPVDYEWEGWGTVDTAIRALDGLPLQYEGFGMQLLDKTHNLPAAGKAFSSTVDFEAAYKRLWGA